MLFFGRVHFLCSYSIKGPTKMNLEPTKNEMKKCTLTARLKKQTTKFALIFLLFIFGVKINVNYISSSLITATRSINQTFMLPVSNY